ncbi:MAG: hypothetical protein QXR57_06820 [Metallosphaera sp.]
MMQIFEGYMIVHKGIVWSVKGCFHPPGHVIALPRYVMGKKVKRMSDELRIVRERFPSYLRYLEEIGFEVPLVPLSESEILDPFSLKKDSLDAKLSEFISLFDNVGVTGSYLYSRTGNDFDLLSTDPRNYFILKELRKKGITDPLTSVEKSELETLDSRDFSLLKSRRVLEGMYKGVPYTFKIVECINFGRVKKIERFEGTIKITEAKKPFSLPVMYLTSLGITLTSFRIRFTEIPVGTTLMVKGSLLHREDMLDLDLDLAEEVKIVELGKLESAF